MKTFIGKDLTKNETEELFCCGTWWKSQRVVCGSCNYGDKRKGE